MPNHIQNHLEIIGHKKHVEDVLNAIKGEGCIDFNSFLPMPEELRGSSSPVKILTKKEYEKQEAKIRLTEEPPFGHFAGITKAMQKDYLERFNSDNWYDWANKHWGTKWGCYNQQMVDIFEAGDQATAQMTFQTAWSSGLIALLQLSERFRFVKFKLIYADEDCGSNVGEFLLDKGGVIEDYVPECGSNEAMEIYFHCWGGEEDWEMVDGEWKWKDDDE